jgi:hypothetical protein
MREGGESAWVASGFLLFSVWFRAINSERIIWKGHAAYKKKREM